MFLWPRLQPPAPPPPPVHAPDAEHVRVLRLIVTDTYRWKHDRAPWRIRFEQDPHVQGITPLEIAALVKSQALPLCAHAALADANVLYVADERDLTSVFDRFGGIAHGPGHISAIQSRDAYVAASQLAARLARHTAPVAADPGRQTDIHWHVIGQDQFRVAQARVGGHDVTVRLGFLGGQEMWCVEVDGVPNCAHFRARADAMSQLGVGVAIEAFGGRRQR